MKATRRHKKKSELEHDHLFRGAFSLKTIVQAHLLEALSPEVEATLDLNSLELASETHIDGDLKASFSDVVWKCRLKSGAEVVITLLFEHKSDLPEQPIFVQLLQYLLGIWQKDLAGNRPLTFVLPIIVYHGQRNWVVRKFWSYFDGFPETLRPYLPDFEYVLSDLARIPDDLIKTKEQMGALRSLYLAFKHAYDETALRENFKEIHIFVGNSGNRYLDMLLTEMLFNYVQKRMALNEQELLSLIATLPDDSKERVMSTYEKIAAQNQKIGIKKGIEQGIELKTRQFVVNLIESTDWDDAKIAMIVGTDVSFVRSIRSDLKENG